MPDGGAEDLVEAVLDTKANGVDNARLQGVDVARVYQAGGVVARRCGSKVEGGGGVDFVHV